MACASSSRIVVGGGSRRVGRRTVSVMKVIGWAHICDQCSAKSGLTIASCETLTISASRWRAVCQCARAASWIVHGPKAVLHNYSGSLGRLVLEALRPGSHHRFARVVVVVERAADRPASVAMCRRPWWPGCPCRAMTARAAASIAGVASAPGRRHSGSRSLSVLAPRSESMLHSGLIKPAEHQHRVRTRWRQLPHRAGLCRYAAHRRLPRAVVWHAADQNRWTCRAAWASAIFKRRRRVIAYWRFFWFARRRPGSGVVVAGGTAQHPAGVHQRGVSTMEPPGLPRAAGQVRRIPARLKDKGVGGLVLNRRQPRCVPTFVPRGVRAIVLPPTGWRHPGIRLLDEFGGP